MRDKHVAGKHTYIHTHFEDQQDEDQQKDYLNTDDK